MEKKKADNLHYLPHSAPGVRSEASDLERLIHHLSGRLENLERRMHESFHRLQNDLQHEKPNAKLSKNLQQEINKLKAGFESQLQKISETVRESLPKPKQEKKIVSLLERVKKIIPNSTKSFQTLWNEEIDPFGRDPAYERKLKPFFDFLYHRYWRTSTYGLENVPSTGRALLVANHSGTLPYDGSMIRMAISNDHPSGRDVRFLVEDFVYYLPFLGTAMYRLGGVRASRDNAELLLNMNHLVAVFPEGVKGIGKRYSKRYHLQRFGRGGFIKLAIRTGSPIIPVAVIGAEEIHPILYKSSLLAKPLGIPYVPITPTLPWLGPLGLIPLPSKWSIYFGKPIDLKHYGKKALEDELQIHKLSEMVRQKIQEMITDALKKRRSVWWG